MGLYLNPPIDKYMWLQTYCEDELKNSDFLFDSVADDEFLVVLVNNGVFTAGGVAYNEDKFNLFTNADDDRAKKYFIVKRKILQPYCADWDSYVK